MSYKMTIVATLEDEEGVMCVQTTVWSRQDQTEMLALEGSYLDWMASLPKTIGGEVVTKKR